MAEELLLDIAKMILSWEGRFDENDNLLVHGLPEGQFEVAGINSRWHLEKAEYLKELIELGCANEAKAIAINYIIEYTEPTVKDFDNLGIRSQMMDISFNRGPSGAIKIAQFALVWGKGKNMAFPQIKDTLNFHEPKSALLKLKLAREQYEREIMGRDEKHVFWEGLKKRWQKSFLYSLSLADKYYSET